ncbi:hypothetical protein T09_4162 [Trichinella sp. T9]|nr:hypothetical protein T09_4162 [Trichinella sp. T9]
MDSIITNTGVNEKYTMKQELCASCLLLMESDEIQFVSTQRNQQKLVYRGRCYTLKQTNRNDKYWICASGSRGCSGKLYTNLDATEIIRTGEHAEGCRVNAHAFYHQQQLYELKRLVAGYSRPVFEVFYELASNASTSLATAAHFTTWEQARNTMYYSRWKRYPRLPLYILYLLYILYYSSRLFEVDLIYCSLLLIFIHCWLLLIIIYCWLLLIFIACKLFLILIDCCWNMMMYSIYLHCSILCILCKHVAKSRNVSVQSSLLIDD